MAMSTTQIRAALKRLGWTYEQVGKLADPPLSTSIIQRNVRKVPSHKSQRARTAIATALDKSVEEVYGEGPARQKVGEAA